MIVFKNIKEIEGHVPHFGDGTGARGLIDEVQMGRRFMQRIHHIFSEHNVPNSLYEDKVSKNKTANIHHLVTHHNKDRDGFVWTGHLNSSSDGIINEGIGFEVLYVNPKLKLLAEELCTAVCKVSGLVNRGAKYRDNLGVLFNTVEPALIIEFGFVNSKKDVALMEQHFDAICYAVASTLAKAIGFTFVTPNVDVSSQIGYATTEDAKTFQLQTNQFTDIKKAEAAASQLLKTPGINYVTIKGYK